MFREQSSLPVLHKFGGLAWQARAVCTKDKTNLASAELLSAGGCAGRLVGATRPGGAEQNKEPTILWTDKGFAPCGSLET